MSESEPDDEPATSMEDLMKLTGKQLRHMLVERNLPCSAKSKELLAKRLFRHLHSFDSSDSDSDSISYEEEVKIPDSLENWHILETQQQGPVLNLIIC